MDNRYKIWLTTALFLVLFQAGFSQTVLFTGTDVTCYGAANASMKIDVSGVTNDYWYLMYDPIHPENNDSVYGSAPSHVFTNLLPGRLYFFIVRDADDEDILYGWNGRTFSQPLELSASVSSTNISCFGALTGSITISNPGGGSGTWDYSIDGSSWKTTGTFNTLPAGTYSVQIRDRNYPDCIKILNAALQITQPDQLQATVNVTNPACYNSDNGRIHLTGISGGSGSYQFTITGGSPWTSTTDYNSLSPGTYNVAMRDANYTACSRTLNNAVVLTEPALLTVSDIVIEKGLTCNEGSDARLRAVPNGGTPPYTYSWERKVGVPWVAIGQTTQTASNLGQGTYRVIVNDVNGCGPANAVEYFTMAFTDSIPPVFYYDGAIATTTCSGQTNGSIDMSAHGGKKPYKFSITTGGATGYQNDSLFGNLAAGSYQPWVMDRKGCKKTGPNVVVGTTPTLPVSVSIAANPSGSICPGTSVQFTATPVNGGTAPVYQWRLNGVATGSNQPTYTTTTLAQGNQVSVIVTSDLRCVSGNPATSNVITASLKTTTAITVQPQPLTQCAGTNATFSVTASGTNLDYQWRKNGTNIPGAKSSSLTLNNITAGDAANYSVVVTGDCGTVTSANAALVVNPATAITAQPQPLVRCAGTSATFTVTAVGTALTYQWRRNGTDISGATSASYTIPSVAAGDAGNYSAVVTGTCGGSVTSNNALLTVNPITVITAQPQPLTQCAGTNATFTVTATGSTLDYQWRKNGTNIPGAKGSSLTLNNITAGDAANYSVVVTGDCGTVTSANAALVVNPATAITAQPQPLVRCAGTSATFSVTAVGTALTYQWRRNGTDISGATSASYTIPSVASGDAGNYSVVVTGTCGGSVTSNNALLTVNPATAITVQPQPLTQCAGTSATFSVTAVGTSLTYQWRRNGTNITGAIAASYTIPAIAAGDAGNYSVIVTGTCGGSVTSNNALLTVNPATAITAQPQPVTRCVGTSATFSVTAVGTNLTYQWRRNGTDISGATNATYTIASIAAGDAGNYSVVVSGTCGGSVTSNNALLTVNPATAITVQPQPLTQCAGTSATFSVTAVGTNLTYQWRRNGTNISGATNATYTIASIAAGNAGNYSVVVSGTCGGSVTSADALLTVNPATAITAQPQPVTQCVGTGATFSVTAVGTNLTYQWRRNGTNISGATNATYTIAGITAGDAGNYSVVVSGTCGGSVTSNNALLTVNPATAITVQPQPVTQCAGTSATFSVTAVGTNLTYQWRRNGTNISGATNATYTIASIAAGNAGNYSVVVSGTCGGSVTSADALLTVNPATAITAQPQPVTECDGNSATFSVTAVGTNLTYQWRRNGTNISGATNASFTIAGIAAGDAGNYSVVVSGTCGGSVTSNNALLTVNPLTSIVTQPLPATVCLGDAAMFQVTAAGTNLQYQWRKNGIDIAGANNAVYNIAVVTAADAGNYAVVVSGNCGPDVTSVSVALSLNPATAIIQQPVSVTECEGNPVTFDVVADGLNLTYQWRKNGTAISGATGNSYSIAAIAASDAGAYTVVVSGTCGSVTSDVATLTVNRPPSITDQPKPFTGCEGTDATFFVSATGENLTYLWRKNNIPIVPAETGSSLTLTNIDAADAGNYDVVVSNSCGDATSIAVLLTVAESPVITGQPSNRDLCEGGDVSFTVTATGTGIAYQWRRDGVPVSGATSATLDITGVTLAQAGTYDVLVYGMCDTVVSNPAVLLVYEATTATMITADTIVCRESTIEFRVDAGGYGVLDYQWQHFYYGSWIDMANDTRISGATTPLLTIQAADFADTGYYRVRVSADCGTVYSGQVRLDVNSLIATIGTPAPFMINSATTYIEAGITVSNHFLKHDLGFSLISPDGTEVVLKAPSEFCVDNHPVNFDIEFNTKADAADTLNYCDPVSNITGTFAATGDWSVLNGMDPSNGAWQIRVYDTENANGDAIDGYITSSTLTFIDLNSEGDTAIVSYNSGDISIGILNPISSEFRPTSYVVPIRLVTSCFNSNDARAIVTVQGGIAPFTYEWTGPTAIPDEDDVMLGPGTYSVLVTDAIGCTSVATVDVTAPPAIFFDAVVHTDTITCFGAAEGMIRAKGHGGSGDLTYTLLPGNIASSVADSGVFMNLAAGAYTIRATDLNGCSLDTLIHIYQHTQLQVNIVTVPVSGDDFGSITLTASGGVPPYQYSIDDGATLQNNGVFDSLSIGIYKVYVVDAAGCIFTADVNLNVELLTVDITRHDVSCPGLADGSFYIALIDGTGPYTLTGPFTDTLVLASGAFSFTEQPAGSYDVKIEDSEGRIFVGTIELNEPAAIVLTDAVITPAKCWNTPDGAIDITASGGTGNLSFEWSDGITTEDRLNIMAGNYEVTISDESSCSITRDFLLTGTTLTIADAGSDTTICPGTTALLRGNPGDSVYWEMILPVQDVIEDPNSNITGVKPEIPTVFIYNMYANGCGDVDTVMVNLFEPIGLHIVDINSIDPDYDGDDLESDTVVYLLEGEKVTLMAATTGSFSNLIWSPDAYITYIDTVNHTLVEITPPTSAYYYVTGTTSNGCTESDTIHLVVARTLKIYNAFSPNGDQYNQTWKIEHAEEYGEKIQVRVFNRWGELVFQSKGYGGSAAWDGTRNGKMLPIGAYFYIIDIKDGKSKPYTGTVTILR